MGANRLKRPKLVLNLFLLNNTIQPCNFIAVNYSASVPVRSLLPKGSNSSVFAFLEVVRANRPGP